MWCGGSLFSFAMSVMYDKASYGKKGKRLMDRFFASLRMTELKMDSRFRGNELC
jgi:hypothetical protein